MDDGARYDDWSRADLVRRVRELEGELGQSRTAQHATGTAGAAPEAEPGTERAPAAAAAAGPSRRSTRYVALKLAYLGRNYGGFEFSDSAAKPSVEEVLWHALVKAHLVFPERRAVGRFDGCEYSKCGRTDRGVSAFGQVIALRLRSNRPPPPAADEEPPPFDPVKDEIPYSYILNNLLPRDIRVLAWCPSPPPGFSARFSCIERQYRYFFTQPAFSPPPSTLGPPGVGRAWLDVEAMRDAAKRFEGRHDLRNFCKVDPSKEYAFSRTIFESDVVEVDDVQSALPYLQDAGFAPTDVQGGPFPKVYYFHFRSRAFLWHQIRYMVAILFLVGQGLEAPAIVSELLDVSKNPRRPGYRMANEVPLVLWDCIFSSKALPEEMPAQSIDELEWVYVGDDDASHKHGFVGLVDCLWQVWRGHKMDELLANQLLRQVSRQGSLCPPGDPAGRSSRARIKAAIGARLFEGGDLTRRGGKYSNVMAQQLLYSPEELSERYAKRKGYAGAGNTRAQEDVDKGKDEQRGRRVG